jgi:hypothetical protein
MNRKILMLEMIQRRLVDPGRVDLPRQFWSLRPLLRLLSRWFSRVFPRAAVVSRAFYVVIYVVIIIILIDAFEGRWRRPLSRRRRIVALAAGDGRDKAAVAGPGQGAIAVVEVDGVALAQSAWRLPA